MVEHAPARVERHVLAQGWSESVYRAPHPALSACVVGEYQGWAEYASTPFLRREIPSPLLPLILNFGAPFRLSQPSEEPAVYSSFGAGLYTRPTIVESAGMSSALQVNLTPLGALRVFGFPLAEISDRTVDIESLMGRPGRELLDRLGAAPGWDERFELIDAFLLDRIENGYRPRPHVVHVWHRLQETDGGLSVAALAHETGYSRRRLTAHVHEQIGLAPKALARLIRLNVAIRLANASGGSWGAIARRCGYCDQAHFVREFTGLAGIPPGEYKRRRLPAGGIDAG